MKKKEQPTEAQKESAIAEKNEVSSPAKTTPKKQFEVDLNKYEGHIARLLSGKHNITKDEFMVKCLTAVSKNPLLLNCTRQSMFASVFYFAELGLPFNTPEGYGYIIPFKNRNTMEATPIIGYRGLIEIAYRNPKLKSLRMHAVYENDEFEFQYGTQEYLKHVPAKSNRGKLKCVYAMAKMEGIDPLFIVIGLDELNEIQRLSKAGNSASSPYNNGTDIFNTMQSKVAIKQLFKVLPKTGNEMLIRAVADDDRLESKEAKSRISIDEEDMPYVEIVEESSPVEEKEVEPIEVEVSKSKESDEEKAQKGEQTSIPMP